MATGTTVYNRVVDDFILISSLSVLEPLPTTHIDKRLVRRDDDLVCRVRFRGRDAYLILLLEFQSTPDRFMALRLLTYQCLVWASLLDRDPELERLPPVFPVVLYNGDARWTTPLDLESVVDPLALEHLNAYTPRYTFHLIDEQDFDREVLATAGNLISVLFTVETTRAQELAEQLKPLAEWLFAAREKHPETTQRILDFIRVRFHDENRRPAELRLADLETPEELRTMLDQTVKELKKISHAKGRAEAQRELAAKLLSEGMSPEQVARLVDLPVDEVKKLAH